MRLHYEAPDIALLGSVMDLTQADLFAPGADSLGSVLGGDNDMS